MAQEQDTPADKATAPRERNKLSLNEYNLVVIINNLRTTDACCWFLKNTPLQVKLLWNTLFSCLFHTSLKCKSTSMCISWKKLHLPVPWHPQLLWEGKECFHTFFAALEGLWNLHQSAFVFSMEVKGYKLPETEKLRRHSYWHPKTVNSNYKMDTIQCRAGSLLP